MAEVQAIPRRFLRVSHGHVELVIPFLAIGAVLNHNLGTCAVHLPVPTLLYDELESLACPQVLGDRVRHRYLFLILSSAAEVFMTRAAYSGSSLVMRAMHTLHLLSLPLCILAFLYIVSPY